jgi:hypothetical protein
MILDSLATSLVSGKVPALLAFWLRQLSQPGERASAADPASTGVILMLKGHGDGVADIRAGQSVGSRYGGVAGRQLPARGEL